jgi:hypothetical protein
MESKKTQKGKKQSSEPEDLYKFQEEKLNHTIKYKYSIFSDLVEQGEYNFYGVVYDSSFPLEEEKTGKYSCTIKLIDHSTNCLSNPNDFNDNIICLTIKSSDKENIPYIHQIGDIIRIHRGFYSPKKKRNVYLNLCNDHKINGSWCLYSVNNNIAEPIACSNKTYNIEEQDKENIETYKAWSKNYLGKNKALVYPYQIKLEERNEEGNDKDLLAHVVKKVETNDQIILFIQDETDGCELHTYKYYNFIKENDIIRVRAYKTFDNTSLILNEFGNILVLPQFSACYKEFYDRLSKRLKQLK